MAQIQEISDYLASNVKDYTRGCDLLEKYGDFSGRMTAKDLRTAPIQFGYDVLVEELSKIVGTTAVVAPTQQLVRSLPLPNAIVRTKAKLHEYWLQLSLLHTKMVDLGESNSEEIKEKRRDIIATRKPFVEAFEKLYVLKEEYFALPEEDRKVSADLLDLLNRLDKPAEHTKEDKRALDANVESLSDYELLKEREKVRKRITRRQNQLQFQSDIAKDRTPNPLPPSPLRTRIENELKMLQPYFKAINDEKDKRKI